MSNVRNKDLGEIGDTLTSLTMELKSLGQEEEEKGLFGFFKKAGNRLETMKVQYSKAEVNVEKIARELEQHQRILMKDIAMFDQMYELNLSRPGRPPERRWPPLFCAAPPAGRTELPPGASFRR